MFNLSKVCLVCCCAIFSLNMTHAKTSVPSKNSLKATVTKIPPSVANAKSSRVRSDLHSNKSLSATALQTKVNLNQASAKQIAKSFKGFGKVRSLAIVKYREEYGIFKNINDLSLVIGISKRFIQKNAERLKLTFTL